jgi:hypothetical protein
VQQQQQQQQQQVFSNDIHCVIIIYMLHGCLMSVASLRWKQSKAAGLCDAALNTG